MRTSYVHVQDVWGPMIGFSAKLSAIASDPAQCYNAKGEKEVDIAFTFCNKKDKQFSKRIARAELADKPMLRVKCKDVPRILAEAECYAWGDEIPSMRGVNNYNYVLRRFL